jgi:hypothetical protein
MDTIVIKLIAALFWAVVVGLLAKRKNRNTLGWGVAGALSWPIALLILAFMPYVCPKCGGKLSNVDAKSGSCSSCDSPSENEAVTQS